MPYGIIYLATCSTSGKSYVGQTTKTLPERKKGHAHEAASGNGWAFHSAIRKYGFDSFSWKQLCECESKEEIDNAERIFMTAFNSLKPNGYNLKEGGSFGKLHPDTKKKISEAGKRRVYTKERNAKISKALTGKPSHGMSEKTKAAIRAANARRKAEGRYTVSQEQKEKIAATLRNRGKI
jgi:group I intron endonuclease